MDPLGLLQCGSGDYVLIERWVVRNQCNRTVELNGWWAPHGAERVLPGNGWGIDRPQFSHYETILWRLKGEGAPSGEDHIRPRDGSPLCDRSITTRSCATAKQALVSCINRDQINRKWKLLSNCADGNLASVLMLTTCS